MSVGEVLAGAARWHVEQGDCLDVLRAMPDASVDAVVTDPPAGIAFMGKGWDTDKGGRDAWIAWLAEIMREALRALKPGGHALVWALPRTSHWTATAVEDAGFEIRDVGVHLFGSGFPKSARVNRDPTFCQCDEPAHSGACTAREPSRGGHTGTAAPSRDGAHCCEGARRSTREEPGSQAGCPPGCDSRGGRLHPAPADARASAPSRGCAPERSRSAEPSDGLACEQARSPSPVRCSGHPSSPGCARRPSREQREEPRSTAQSTPPKRGIGTRSGPRESRTRSTVESLSASHERNHGLPICEVCGKPISNGWGTALKPASEHWILARKPLVGTVAANVAEYGTGAVNVDACRIGTSDNLNGGAYVGTGERASIFGLGNSGRAFEQPAGRWPANVVLSHLPECREVGVRRVRTGDPTRADGTVRSGPRSVYAMGTGPTSGGYASPDGTEEVPAFDCAPGCAVAALDEQSGELRARGNVTPTRRRRSDGVTGWGVGDDGPVDHGDTGGASRFYYVAKASTKERNAGCEHLSAVRWWDDAHQGTREGTNETAADGVRRPRESRNHHPTVKPLALMRWLARLVTPPGGVVLDPFAGSGSTGCACALEGFRFVGIEREPEYVEIARARIAHWEAAAQKPAKPRRAPKPRPAPPPPSAPRPVADERQIDLFDRRTA